MVNSAVDIQLDWLTQQENAAAEKAAAEKAAEKAAAEKAAEKAVENAAKKAAEEGIGRQQASSRPSVKQFSVTEDGNLISIKSELENDFTFKNNILINTISTFNNVFDKLFTKNDDSTSSEYIGLPDGELHTVIENIYHSTVKKSEKLPFSSRSGKTFKNIFNFKSWNWVTVITKYMFKIAAYIAYNKVLKIKGLQPNNLQPKELAEIYVDLIYKYIEQLFTSTGIISTFGTLVPGGQFLKSGSDLIFRYYKQYILLTEKYFEIEFIKNNKESFNTLQDEDLNLNIKSKYVKILTIFNKVLTSAISGGKSKTKRQNKKTKQKSKTKRQNKKAKQKSKTKKQNKKAKQNMINY